MTRLAYLGSIEHWFALKVFSHFQDILKRVQTYLKMKIALHHYGLWKIDFNHAFSPKWM